MKRLHLFEIGDQPWCPAILRDFATDYLQFTTRLNNPYASLLSSLAKAIDESGGDLVIDLCSGAGGPWLILMPKVEEKLERPLRVWLTDFYPYTASVSRKKASTDGVYRVPIAVDARHVPFNVPAFRTIFAGLHHFRPDDVRAILQDAVSHGHGIAAFEATQRRFAAIALIVVSALLVFLVTPFMRPLRLSRFLFTYIIPAVPFIVLFDGIVSCLRTYTPAELKNIATDLSVNNYDWQVGEAPIPGAPIRATYLIGAPPVRATE